MVRAQKLLVRNSTIAGKSIETGSAFHYAAERDCCLIGALPWERAALLAFTTTLASRKMRLLLSAIEFN